MPFMSSSKTNAIHAYPDIFRAVVSYADETQNFLHSTDDSMAVWFVNLEREKARRKKTVIMRHQDEQLHQTKPVRCREKMMFTSQIDSKCIISQHCCGGWISLCSDDETRATIRKEEISTDHVCDSTTLPRKVKLLKCSSLCTILRFLENAHRQKHTGSSAA